MVVSPRDKFRKNMLGIFYMLDKYFEFVIIHLYNKTDIYKMQINVLIPVDKLKN